MKETNQSMAVASEPMAMQPAIARKNGRGVWLYNSPPASASQISSLQRQTPFFADSLLTPGSAVETPQAAGLGLCSDQLADLVIPCSVDPKNLTKRANFTALLQMPWRHCKTCKFPPACGWCSNIPCWLRPQWDWLLPLRELQSCLSTRSDSFLFRERQLADS